MYDQRLAKMLLDRSQRMVVLVGEPVFRLSEALNLVFDSPDFEAVVPMVCQFESIEEYIDASKASGRNVAQCSMCLHLPTDTPDAENLLGLATRTSPSLLLVEHTQTSPTHKLLSDEQFFAFGFRVLEKTGNSGHQTALYAYSLSDYKKAPDWLNARYWAHPERFGVLE